jgi:lipid II:glycine glycyltransferase (peptidoglycan interpeptide bridge formation enzyme)
MEKVRSMAKEKRTIFFRTDPHITEASMSEIDDPFIAEGFQHLPYRWTYWNAPRDVYRVDLAMGEGEEELFQSIDPKARTGIRKAKKEGVIIRPAESLEEVKAFHAAYKKFAIEKGFLFRSFSYQESLWKEFISRGRGRLFLSIHDGEIIGGQICLVFGELCVEMHRGVLYQHHKLRVNEALVWEGMRWAKGSGCRWYCQRGVGAGPLQKFKQKFRPQLVSLVGYYDLCFYPRIYSIITFLEFKMLPSAVNIMMRLRRRIGKIGRST